jgi:hypothetical protein
MCRPGSAAARTASVARPGGAVAAAKRIDTTSGAMKGYTEDPNDADRID